MRKETVKGGPIVSANTPEAYTTHWFKCDMCEQLHVAFTNKDNEAICIADMSREMLVRMLNTIDRVEGTNEHTCH